MLGSQIGPYSIEAELGAGGMGTVYRARVVGDVPGLGPGTQVALKVVHPHLLATPGFFKRFLREAELGRSIEHPNVVRTYDVDATLLGEKQVNFMVLEYVEGRSLRSLLRELGTVPEALLREIALQITAGLTAVHQEGVVHRDLKPENVLITDDHHVRIMDLGVAKLQEASIALTLEGQFAGSLLYAAPEQFRQEEVGWAADLYSLGVMLYELATGSNPFHREGMVLVIQAHLEHEAPWVGDRNPAISDFLSEVISTLLSKQPDDRFESTVFLQGLLAEGEGAAWWKERAAKRRKTTASVPSIGVRRETRLYGRAGELDGLREAWNSIQAGGGKVMLLSGEAGIGKTRLVDAFISELVREEVHVLYGSFPPEGGMSGLTEAVVRHMGAGVPAETVAPLMTATPALVPSFTAFLRHEAPPERGESLAGDALHAAMVHLMRGLADERPLLWVVDDLHFAEASARALVLSMARAVEGHRVLLLLTSRPGVPEDFLAHLSRLDGFVRRDLGRLSPRDVVVLLREAFGSRELADKLGGKVAYKSDGVPFFVFEMIRSLEEGEYIKATRDGTYIESRVIEEIHVPSAVRDLVEARLRELDDEDRNLLDVAAVQGYEFDPALAARVWELRRIVALSRLAALERRLGVVRAVGRRYRFDHHQIHEVISSSLSPRLCEEYHTALAEAYLTEEGLDEETAGEIGSEAAVFLAGHFLRGGQPRRGLPYLATALEHLQRTSQNETAVALVDHALEHEAVDGTERVDLLLAKSRCLEVMGRWDEQRRVLVEAQEGADRSGPPSWRARVRRHLARHRVNRAEAPAAVELLGEALDLARQAGDLSEEGRIHSTLGDAHRNLGRMEAAREHYERYLKIARETSDRAREGVAMSQLGVLLRDLGRYGEAREHLQSALDISRETGHRVEEADALGHLGGVSRLLGQADEARVCQERAMALAREVGHRRGEATAAGDLGLALWNLGRHEEALNRHEHSLAIYRELGDRMGEATSLLNAALVLYNLGRYEDSRDLRERALVIRREIKDPTGEAFAALSLSGVLASLGRYGEAEPYLDLALDLSRRTKNRRLEGVCRVLRSQFLLVMGRPDLAESEIAEALAILEGIGARRHAAGALRVQAQVDDRAGRLEAALAKGGEALAIQTELGDRSGSAASQAALARILVRAGEREEQARAHLLPALATGRELSEPVRVVQSLCLLALLPGGDADQALEAFEADSERLGAGTTMDVRFLLWRARGEPDHLEEAHRLLLYLRDHAPEGFRQTLMEGVPLHREIQRAWEENARK